MNLPSEFRIGDRPVGARHPAYVIAEIGANHNRDLSLARELVDQAVEAGADAVKFQTYSGSRLYSRKTPRFRYLEALTDKTPAEFLEQISLPRDWQPVLADHARARGVHFFSSPFDHEALLAAQAVVDDLMLAPERLPDLAQPDPVEAIRQARRLRAPVLQHRWERLTPAVVDALHDAGIAVWAWPTDSDESIAACVRLGVDAVIGDDVGWLLPTVTHGNAREPAVTSGL